MQAWRSCTRSSDENTKGGVSRSIGQLGAPTTAPTATPTATRSDRRLRMSTASGETAVQIVHKRGRVVEGIDHVGAAHDADQLALLEELLSAGAGKAAGLRW